MDGTWAIEVSTLPEAERLALESQLVISLGDRSGPEADRRPPQTLEDWALVYNGLSDEEVADVDRIIKTRADLTRQLP